MNYRSQQKYHTFHPSVEKAKLNASEAYVTLDEKFFINSCSAKCEWLQDKTTHPGASGRNRLLGIK